MANYKQIQKWVKENFGFVPKTCWIADVKEQCGIKMKKAWNREGMERIDPCPEDKREAIRMALLHFGMIKS
ncbi:MAG TPA: hypothetical protein PLY41_04885 [Acetomicrobium sp.]|nr:hypothetical protein [Acetomicrobium sp.]